MRRIIRTIGLLLAAIFLLPVAVWLYYDIKFGRQLEAKLAELKAQGMPLTLAEAAPQPVPDDQNAAVLYQKVFHVQFVSEEPYDPEKAMAGLSKDELELLDDYRKEPSAQLRNQVRQLLARPQVREALELFCRGSKRPHCVFPVNWQDGPNALFPHLGRFRNAAQIVAAQALMSTNEGHIDETLDWCEVALRMSEHAGSDPTLIAQLVSYAIQAMALDAVKQFLCSAEFVPSTVTGFEKRLRRLDLNKGFSEAMVGERAMGYQALHMMYRRPGNFSEYIWLVDLRPAVLVPLYFTPLCRPLHKLDQLIDLEYMAKQIEFTKFPYYKAKARVEAEYTELHNLPMLKGVLTKAFCAMLWEHSFQKRDRAVANIGLCRVVLALKAYKYERGLYPATLKRLQETLDWDLPQDPFSGQDFVYSRQGEGFKLYSFGPDLDDGSGMLVANQTYEDGDIVWQCAR